MQIFTPFAATAVAAGLALAGAAALPAAAQDDAPEAPEAPEAAAPADFSDSQLEAFAQAAVDVAEIRDQYAMELNEIEDQAEQEQLVEEGNAAMLAAVEDNPDITLDEYLEIGEAAAADPELGERISTMIQDMMEG